MSDSEYLFILGFIWTVTIVIAILVVNNREEL